MSPSSVRLLLSQSYSLCPDASPRKPISRSIRCSEPLPPSPTQPAGRRVQPHVLWLKPASQAPAAIFSFRSSTYSSGLHQQKHFRCRRARTSSLHVGRVNTEGNSSIFLFSFVCLCTGSSVFIRHRAEGIWKELELPSVGGSAPLQEKSLQRVAAEGQSEEPDG